MRTAFKEWAIVVDALGRGEQLIILRKGGISEGRGGFTPEHQEFLLFPTLFHQQRESVIASAQARYDQIAPGLPAKEILRLEYWGRVTGWEKLESAEAVLNLRGHHIWRDEVVEERMEWSKHKHIYCLFVRVYKLPQRIELPMLPEYGGCKSWITLAEDIAIEGSRPVVDDREFQERLQQIIAAVQRPRLAA